ncbi:hypothetical protein VZT92_007674 [Zoarces viviparus]|uniref:Secreted protein n=1 Tax=Zoarces viviparus TaxID=48416 RepID=A0AAW1FKR9_ZOAVI
MREGERKVALAVGRCWLQCQLVGGGPTCLWLSPVSLSSTVEKATDGVRRFCSGPSAASSGLSHPPARGHRARGDRYQTLHRHKGQLLTERARPSFSHKHCAASPWTQATTASLR